jgi:hypothetical protein
MNDKENLSNLELLGLPVDIRYSGTPKGRITVCVNPQDEVASEELEALLLQMASSHSFVQSRYEHRDLPDDITPSLWGNCKLEDVLP